MDESYAKRHVYVGFSGGERKKSEILQMLMLDPKLAILDETDSVLDVDAVKTRSSGSNQFKNDLALPQWKTQKSRQKNLFDYEKKERKKMNSIKQMS